MLIELHINHLGLNPMGEITQPLSSHPIPPWENKIEKLKIENEK
jgi:hypothetical protein